MSIKTSLIMSAIAAISPSFMPRVVTAGVPRRIPLAFEVRRLLEVPSHAHRDRRPVVRVPPILEVRGVPQVAIVALKEDLISIEETNTFTAAQRAQARANISSVLKGQIYGLTLSTPGSSTGFNTAPGEAMVAATALGSSVSSAKPRLNTSGSAPHASAAAFIEGAATASSKKPPAVVR